MDPGDPAGAVQFEHLEVAMRSAMSNGLHLDLEGKRVAVIGFGRSGQSALRLLHALGAHVSVADQKPVSELTGMFTDAGGLPAGVFGGGQYEQALRGSDLALISPGVPVALEALQKAKAGGIPLIGELELASRYLTGRLIAVTGTKGKTTTVSSIGDLLRAAASDAFVGAVLGAPLADAALASLQGHRWDLVVAEVSSFQLETIET